MCNKEEILKVYQLKRSLWIQNEDDDRKESQMIIDFTKDCIDYSNKELIEALKQTNQLLTSLIPDPTIQKDQKAYIINRIEANLALIKPEESEVKNG